MNLLPTTFIDSWWQWQTTVFWQGGAAFLILLLLFRWLGSKPLRWQYALLLVVMAKCVLVWPLHFALPWNPSLTSASIPIQPEPMDRVFDDNTTDRLVDSPPAAPYFEQSTPSQSLNHSTPTPVSPRWEWLLSGKESLFLIWIMGIAVLGMRIAAGIMQIHQFRRAGAPHAELTDKAHQLGQRMGIRQEVPVYVTPSMHSPLVMGLIRPVILVPMQCSTLTSDQLDMLLCHELSHIKRKDHWISWLRLAAVSVVWWNPVIHVLNRWITAVVEQRCDNQVLEMHPKRQKEYGQLLLDIVESTVRFHSIRVATAFSDTRIVFRQRIRNIARFSQWRYQPTLAAYAILGVVGLALLPVWSLVAMSQGETAWFERFETLNEQSLELQQDRFPGIVSNVSKYGDYPNPSLSPDGRYLLAKITNGPLNLLDLQEGKIIATFGGDEIEYTYLEGKYYRDIQQDFRIHSVSWSPDSKRIFIAAQTHGLLWNLTEKKTEKKWTVPGTVREKLSNLSFRSCAYSPDGRWVAVGLGDLKDEDGQSSRERGTVYRVFLYDVATGQAVYEFLHRALSHGPIVQVEFSPDQQRLLSASQDGIVRVWNLETKEEEAEMLQNHLQMAAYSPDGKRIVFAAANTDFLGIKSTETYRTINSIQIPARFYSPVSLAINSNGNRLILRSMEGRCYLWEPFVDQVFEYMGANIIEHGRLIGILKDQKGYIVGAGFLPDNQTAVTLSSDGVIAYWNTDTGVLLKTTQGDWYIPEETAQQERIRLHRLSETPTEAPKAPVSNRTPFSQSEIELWQGRLMLPVVFQRRKILVEYESEYTLFKPQKIYPSMFPSNKITDKQIDKWNKTLDQKRSQKEQRRMIIDGNRVRYDSHAEPWEIFTKAKDFTALYDWDKELWNFPSPEQDIDRLTKDPIAKKRLLSPRKLLYEDELSGFFANLSPNELFGYPFESGPLDEVTTKKTKSLNSDGTKITYIESSTGKVRGIYEIGNIKELWRSAVFHRLVKSVYSTNDINVREIEYGEYITNEDGFYYPKSLTLKHYTFCTVSNCTKENLTSSQVVTIQSVNTHPEISEDEWKYLEEPKE